MVKKLKKDVIDFTKAGVGLGIGTAVVAGMPGGAAVTPAFATAGSMMGIVGTGMMGMHTLRIVNKGLMPQKRKRRR